MAAPTRHNPEPDALCLFLETGGDLLSNHRAAEWRLSGRRLRFTPCRRAALIDPKTLGRSRLQRPWAPGRLGSDGSESSSRLQRLTSGIWAWRCAGLQPQVREDLLDHRLLQDGRNDLQLGAAVRAVLQVEVESEASAQTNFYSSYVVAKTRMSSLAQLSRSWR